MQLETWGLALALAVLPMTAMAQDTAPGAAAPNAARQEARQKMRAACAADLQKFCANVGGARGATRTCLDTHAAQLSDSCKAARLERAAAKDKS